MEPSEKAVTMEDVDSFAAAFRAVPEKSREDGIRRALNLVPDENALLLAGVLMEDSHPEPRRDASYFAEVFYGFRPTAMRANRLLYLVLLAYCVFAIAMQVFMPYYVLYLRLPYILGEKYVFVMAPCIVIAAVFTILYGRTVDRRGFLRSIILPIVALSHGKVLPSKKFVCVIYPISSKG
jgi:hypothetical protein